MSTVAEPTDPARPVSWVHRLLRTATHPKVLALLDQAVVSGTNFATTLVIGRSAGAEELGSYSLGFTLVVAALCVQDAFVSGPYTVFANRLTGLQRAELAGSSLIQQASWGVFFAVASLVAVLVRLDELFGVPQLRPILWVLALAFPWFLLREFQRRLAFAHLHTTTALCLDITIASLQLIGLISLHRLGLLSAASAYVASGLACGTVVIAWLVAGRRQFGFRREEIPADVQRNWRFGKWLVAGQLTAIVYWYLVHWLLALRLDTTATGAFVACMTVVTLANPFVLGIGNIVGPTAALAYAEGKRTAVRHVIVQATLLVSGATMLLAVVTALVGGELISWLYNGDYVDQNTTIALLALLVPIVGANVMAEHGLRTLERAEIGFQGSLLSLVTTFIVAWCLIDPWGLEGAALGLLAGETVGLVVRWSVLWWATSQEGTAAP